MVIILDPVTAKAIGCTTLYSKTSF